MENPQNAVECSAFYDKSETSQPLISTLIEGFLEYARYELNFSPKTKTIIKSRDSLGWQVRVFGDKGIGELSVQDFVRLKKLMMERGVGPARIASPSWMRPRQRGHRLIAQR